MSQKLAGVKGMYDILPEDVGIWQLLESTARRVLRAYGYSEIRTPMVEDTALFVRGVGEDTDMVGKEMYTFEDKGGRSITLRPEGTAPAVRAYIEHSVSNKEPVTHWFYIGPMFRYERMKTGRYRQFFQLGVEAYGASEPAQDVETMDVAVAYLEALGLKEVRLTLNSIGDDQCRPPFQAKLLEYLRGHREALCEDCQARMEKNPLRVLDCKNPRCQQVAQGAPKLIEALCGPCQAHFDEVQRQLKLLETPFEIDPKIVRGLDYYTRTAFEFIAQSPVLGTASAVGGGGRYDKLVRALGGPDVPAVGLALGLDRLKLLLSEAPASPVDRPAVFIAAADGVAKDAVLKLAHDLRKSGVWVEVDPRLGSLKSQMKRADKLGARYALVLGERELQEGAGQLKPMDGGEPRPVRLVELAKALADTALPHSGSMT